MTTFTITGDDTLTIGGRVLTDLADADNSTVTFPNNVVESKTGKNGNTIFAKNAMGQNADLVVRVIRGSSDDRFLQGELTKVSSGDISSYTLLDGSFVKRLGDGAGVVILDTYTMTGGIPNKKIDGKENSDGDIEQAVSVYNFKFAQVVRSAQ